MQYPKETLTVNREGKTEVRSLVDSGDFFRYASQGKVTLLLKSLAGKQTRAFIMKPSGKRLLLIPYDGKWLAGETKPEAKPEKGLFVIYEYLDPETGKPAGTKSKLVLVPAGAAGNGDRCGKSCVREEFFLIPLSHGRLLAMPSASKGPLAVWDEKKAVTF